MAAGDIVVVNGNTFGRKGNVLDGVDDYILHDAHAVARVAAADTIGTYTAWIYLDNTTGTNTILSAGDNNSTNETFTFDVFGQKLRVILKNGAATTQFDVIETSGSITARNWHHVAVVQNGTRPTLYVDGVASAMTDTTSTSLSDWYADIGVGPVDKFAIGVAESNNTHLVDFKGAIGQVKYFNIDLTASEIFTEFRGETNSNTTRAAEIETARVFDITMENDGITDDGSGADNGTLTGNAYYAGEISDWSYVLAANVSGHAAEDMNTIDIGQGKFLTVIKRGD